MSLKPTVFTDTSLVSVSLVIVIISGVFGVSQIYSLAHENKNKISKVDKERMSIDIRIFDRLEEVENKIDKISEKVHSYGGKMDILIRDRKDKDKEN